MKIYTCLCNVQRVLVTIDIEMGRSKCSSSTLRKKFTVSDENPKFTICHIGTNSKK